MEHPEMGNITEEVLEDQGCTFLAVSYNINKANPVHQWKLNKLAAYAREQGIGFYGLTASLTDDVQAYKETHAVTYDYCSTDEIQLKTIVRSNPGLVLLHAGTVINKWGYRDIPDVEEIRDKNLLAYSLSAHQAKSDDRLVYMLALLYAACLGFYLAKKYKKSKN